VRKPSLELNRAFEFLERDDLTSSSIYSGILKLPFDVKPDQFLEFATVDFDENSAHSRVNALSNIKRAIDCRMDSLLCVFGLYSKSRKEDWGFPKKVEILSTVGVVAPGILMRINKERNKLEHAFRIPKHKEVEDFLDVARLFLSATEILVNREVKEIQLSAEEMEPKRRYHSIDLRPHLTIYLDVRKGTFKLALVADPKPPQVSSEVKVGVDDRENYLKILFYWVRAIRQKF